MNENINVMNNAKLGSAKKAHIFIGLTRCVKEPKEVTVNLVSNNKEYNYNYTNKIKSTSNHIKRSSSSNLKDRNSSFNASNKIHN